MPDNKTFEFRLSKKLAPAPSGATGLILRGIETFAASDVDSPLCEMNVNTRSAEGNKSVREAAGFFSISTGNKLKIVGKGKSVSIQVSREEGREGLDKLMAFGSCLHFVNTDASEAIEFYNKYLSAEGVKENLKLQPSMAGLAVTSITADTGSIEFNVSAILSAPLKEEDILEALRPAMDSYDVGMIRDQ